MILILKEFLPLLQSVDLIQQIGDGGNSTIYSAFFNDKKILVKCPHCLLNSETIDYYIDEFKIYQKCNLMNGVVHFIGFSVKKFKDEYQLYLYMDDNNMCDLDKYIKSDKLWINTPKKYVLSDDIKKQISIDLCKNLIELHNSNIVHCDYKTSNIVIDDKNNTKIIDLEASIVLSDNTERCHPNIGTQGYMAPEIIEGYCSVKSDIYSLGVVLIELWNGRLWRTDSDDYDVSRNDVLLALREIKYHYSHLEKILRRCILKDCTKRPKISTILKYFD